MASQKLGETKGPIIVALFFRLYPALLVTVFAPFTTIRSLTIENLIIQNLEFYGVLLIFLIAFVALRENRRSLRDISLAWDSNRTEPAKACSGPSPSFHSSQ